MKIVVIGAGSASFGRGILADLFQEEAQALPELEIALVDVDREALAKMGAFGERLRESTGSTARLSQHTDRREALPGADYVITAVSVRRMELWEQDFRVPQAHGVEHILGENGGPGALFHALRSLELVLPICADVEELCPQALLLNFTNPEARILHAVLHLTRVRAVGLCHGVFGLELLASRLTGLALEELEVTSAGLNHVFCALSIKEKRTGREWLPEVLRRVQEDEAVQVPPLYREMARIYDVLSYPSDDHIGEYFSFGTDFHGRKWHYGLESRRVTDRSPGVPTDVVGGFLRGEVPLAQALEPSGEVAVPLICARQQAEPVRFSAVNVLNSGPLIANLPEAAAVEVPALVSRDGLTPLPVGPLPEGWAAHLRTQCAIIALLTEAYRTRSKKLLLQALLLDPCMHSVRGARALLEDMLQLQAAYLPAFD